MNKVKFILIITTIIATIITFNFFQPKKEYRPVKFGYLPISGSVSLFVAQEKDFFKKNGVTVELIKFESSNPLIEALISGKIDAEIGTSSFVIASLASKVPNTFKVFLVNSYDTNNYTTSLIVNSKSNISSIKDLKGKKIGCFPGITNKTLIRLFLEKNDSYDNNTQIIEIAAGLQLSALYNGNVDAISTYEPYGTMGIISKRAKIIVKAPIEKQILSPWVAGTASFNSNFLINSPKEAKAIKKSLYEAIDLMNNNPQEARSTLTKYTPIKDKKVTAQIPLPKTLKTNEISIKDFARTINLFYREKLLEKNIDVKSIILN
jgi:NitT/TauT family transport system substrate-binding protein